MRRTSFAFRSKPSLSAESRSASSVTPAATAPDAPSKEAVFRLFDLPLELQGEILVCLDYGDIVNLRLTSRSCLRFLEASEQFVVRYLWRKCFIRGDMPCLCPPRPGFVTVSNVPPNPTFSDFFRYAHRENVVRKVADVLTRFMEEKVLRLRVRGGVRPINNLRWNLMARLRLALSHLDGYWKEYRLLVEEDISGNRERDNAARQRVILDQFCVPCLLECYGAFDLLFLVLCMKLRPKTYAGAIERAVRRWNVDAAPLGDVVMMLVYGGLDAASFLLATRPYPRRRAALSSYVEYLTTSTASSSKGPKSGWSIGSKFSTDWSRLELLTGPYSTVSAERSPPYDLALQRQVYYYVSTLDSRQLFESWETRLLAERRDTRRPLLGGFEWAFAAMQYGPRELDFARIQEDWTTHYAPPERPNRS